jgi:hypothetical protein
VGVAGDEVDRPVGKVGVGQGVFDVLPPAVGGAFVVGQGTGEEADGEGLFFFGDDEEVGGRFFAPDAGEAVYVVGGDAAPGGQRF